MHRYELENDWIFALLRLLAGYGNRLSTRKLLVERKSFRQSLNLSVCAVYSAFWIMDSVRAAPTRANEPKLEMGRAGAALRILLCVAVAGLIVLTIVRTAIWWKSDAGISFASGVMITMAADLTRATFYRPLFGPAGYGGTRYFPLYFSLQALLIKLGMPVLASAYLISAAAIVLLLWGTFRLLRELGTQRWLAVCAAVMLLASSSVQMALTTPQADGLAAALNVWALVMVARSAQNRRSIFPAALLFTLAWSAKVTTVFGLAAAIVWLAVAGHKRLAWRLALQAACGYAVVAAVMMLASRGRVLEIFRACASGGTKLAISHRGTRAHGVDGALHRSDSASLRGAGVAGTVFLESTAQPVRLAADYHTGDHHLYFRLAGHGTESSARRASGCRHPAGYVGGDGTSAAKATRCVRAGAADVGGRISAGAGISAPGAAGITRISSSR